MINKTLLFTTLAGVMSLILASCGGDGSSEKESSESPASTSATEAPAATDGAPKAAGTVAPPEIAATAIMDPTKNDGIKVADNRPDTAYAVDLSRQGDTIDFTVGIREDAILYAQTRAGIWFEPDEMTFKLGQTVNFTIKPPADSKKSYTFTIADFNMNHRIKYGKSVSFTYTFDEVGSFRFRSFPGSEFGMIGVIRVVE